MAVVRLQHFCRCRALNWGMSERSVDEDKQHWQKLGEKTAELLGLERDNIDAICQMPYEQIAAAAVKAGEVLHYPGGMMLFQPSPVAGMYEGLESIVGFREETKHIPVMAGTMLGEFSFMHYLGDKNKYSEVEKYNILEQTYGRHTMAVISAFREVYPQLDILYALSVDARFRFQTKEFLMRRAAFAKGKCYNYLMTFIIPYLGGLAPWHCGDIPFVFRNVDMEPAHCTGYEYTTDLSNHISKAWLAFMKHGNLSTKQLKWTNFTPSHPDRMIFDRECHIETKDDSALLKLIASCERR